MVSILEFETEKGLDSHKKRNLTLKLLSSGAAWSMKYQVITIRLMGLSNPALDM